jgi:hypothetical protein
MAVRPGIHIIKAFGWLVETCGADEETRKNVEHVMGICSIPVDPAGGLTVLWTAFVDERRDTGAEFFEYAGRVNDIALLGHKAYSALELGWNIGECVRNPTVMSRC